jgi:hypothetical protein
MASGNVPLDDLLKNRAAVLRTLAEAIRMASFLASSSVIEGRAVPPPIGLLLDLDFNCRR